MKKHDQIVKEKNEREREAKKGEHFRYRQTGV